MRMLLIVLPLIVMMGCSSGKTVIKEVKVDHIVYKVKEVRIPVACDAEVSCNFEGKGFAPTMQLLKCVVEQKRALDYCKQIHK